MRIVRRDIARVAARGPTQEEMALFPKLFGVKKQPVVEETLEVAVAV